MLRVSTNLGLSPDELAAEHTDFRVAQVKRQVEADWSWVVCPYDFSSR
ncbi:MAG TPA: hypothetical protein VF290_01095 [Pyrinomonadaceae bacterium]